MLRAEDVICGTSSTGTGTLTLAACPVPPGGVDFYAWLTSTGYNFVNGNAVLVSYVIKEYTGSTFATVLQSEEGVGTLTLGASLTASTLARTTVQAKQTAESTTGVYAGNAPSAMTIGTAANVLVFVGPKAADMPAFPPYFETSIGDNLGVGPVSVDLLTITNGLSLNSGEDDYYLFEWRVPMLVKKISMRVEAAYSGGTSNLYARIYQIGSNGRPGKLLLNLGVLGTANSSLGSTGNKTSALHSSGFFLTPGEYYLDVLSIYSGGSGSPILTQIKNTRLVAGGRQGTTNMLPYSYTKATSGNSTAPDPANTTSYAGQGNSSIQNAVAFTLNAS